MPPTRLVAKTFCVKLVSESSGYSQSASLLAHNQIAATQLIRRGLPLLIQASPHPCLLLFAIEAGDLLDLVKHLRN